MIRHRNKIKKLVFFQLIHSVDFSYDRQGEKMVKFLPILRVLIWYKNEYHLLNSFSHFKSIDKMNSKFFAFLLVGATVFCVVLGSPARSERKGE